MLITNHEGGIYNVKYPLWKGGNTMQVHCL